MPAKTPIEILFAATSDYLPYAVVTALSVIDKVGSRSVNIHFMYADIVNPITDAERKSYFERATFTIGQHKNAHIFFYDLSDKVPLLDGQNIGLWGEYVSKTHYFYLLAQSVLPESVDKVIYLDTDTIANHDLSDVFDMDMGKCLISMGAPRGFEEMGDDVSNAGFVVLNLKQWRIENTMDSLFAFGRKMEKSRFCAQNLLYQYFTKSNPDRLLLVDKEYNIFPQLFWNMKPAEIKVMHFTGWESCRPWVDYNGKQRCSEFWWYYARQTAFYEQFIMNIIDMKISNNKKHRHHSIWWHLKHMKF